MNSSWYLIKTCYENICESTYLFLLRFLFYLEIVTQIFLTKLTTTPYWIWVLCGHFFICNVWITLKMRKLNWIYANKCSSGFTGQTWNVCIITYKRNNGKRTSFASSPTFTKGYSIVPAEFSGRMLEPLGRSWEWHLQAKSR